MGTIIFVLILLCTLWLIFKILKGIISFLFSSNSDKETSNHDDGPSDLKYNNELYISLRNIVQNAYEGYKKSGFNTVWDSHMDGFYIFDHDSLTEGGSMYAVNVNCDKQNLLELNDSFYIVVTYGIVFNRRNYNDYKEQAEYLNNYLHEIKKTGITYAVDLTKGSNLGVYYSALVVSDYNKLYEDTKKLGEVELFRQLIGDARENYYVGKEIYNAKIRNAEKY